MLLRSLFFLLFSSQVLSAGITIDVDLQMTIDAIKYVDRDSQDAALFAHFNTSGECPQSSDNNSNVIANDIALESFLSTSGFTLTSEAVSFDGSNLDNFEFNQDGTWTVYDDINRKLVRNWDKDCPHAPRPITFYSNYENIHTVGVVKELDMAYFNSDEDGDVINLGVEGNLAWLDEKPEGKLEKLFFVDGVLFAKMSDGERLSIWQVKPEWKKKMVSSKNATIDVIKTDGGLLGVEKSGVVTLLFLSSSINNIVSYKVNDVVEYGVYPFLDGTMIAANSLTGWTFRWLEYGEKAKEVLFPRKQHDVISCHKSGSLFLCLDKRESGEVYIWRFLNSIFGQPTFTLDSIIPEGVLADDMAVESIQTSTTHRLLTVNITGEYGLLIIDNATSRYKEIEDISIFKKDEKKMNHFVSYNMNTSTLSRVSISGNKNVFYYPFLVSQTKVFKDLDEKADEDAVVPIPDEDDVTDLVEREETSGETDKPRERAEISGAISPYYLFTILLLLITSRRKFSLKS